MSNGKTKAGSAVSTDLSTEVGVHTSALPDSNAAPSASTHSAGCVGCGGCAGGCDKPVLYQPSPLCERDAFSGGAGRYVRDPGTGEHRKAE